jgi:hypothetical protein
MVSVVMVSEIVFRDGFQGRFQLEMFLGRFQGESL